MSSQEFISANEVRKELSFIERLMGELSSDDEYLEAILRNQRLVGMLALSIMEGEGIEGGLKDREEIGGDGSSFDNLPNDYVGVSMDDMASGESGNSIFPVKGSYIHADVRASSEISRGNAVEVIGEDNLVRPLEDVDITRIGVGVDDEDFPYFDISITGATKPSSLPGDVGVKYIVTNTGGVAGSQDIVLKRGNQVVDERKSVSLNPGDGVTGTLKFTVDSGGKYGGAIETDDEREEFSVEVEGTSGAQYLVNITGVS
jgi:hypothetical protein